MTDRDARYRRKLLVLLSSATFFEGYDNYVLAFVLALVLGNLGGSEADARWIRGRRLEPQLLQRDPQPGALVPFRLVTKEGEHIDGVGHLLPDGSSWRIADARTGGTVEEGGAPFGAGLPGWPIALAAGAFLALAALGLLTIVQRCTSAA